MEHRRPRSLRRLIVPAVLAVTVVGAVALSTSSSGCGDNKPIADAGPTADAGPDTPII